VQIYIKFCTRCHPANVYINRAKFYLNRSGVLILLGVEFLAFASEKEVAVNTWLELPFSLWWLEPPFPHFNTNISFVILSTSVVILFKAATKSLFLEHFYASFASQKADGACVYRLCLSDVLSPRECASGTEESTRAENTSWGKSSLAGGRLTAWVISIVPWMRAPWVAGELWRSTNGISRRFFAHVAAVSYFWAVNSNSRNVSCCKNCLL